MLGKYLADQRVETEHPRALDSIAVLTRERDREVQRVRRDSTDICDWSRECRQHPRKQLSRTPTLRLSHCPLARTPPKIKTIRFSRRERQRYLH
jgi:hypothetical protein